MGANNFFDDDFDYDNAKYERMNRVNPPEFAPAQGDDFDDLFSADFDQPVSGGGFDVFSSNQPTQGSGNTMGSFGMPDSNQQNMGQQNQGLTSEEDKIFNMLATGAKGTVSFSKEIVNSFKGLTPKFYSRYGKNLTFTSIGVFIVGFIMLLFRLSLGFKLMTASIFSCALGVGVLMLRYEAGSLCSSEYKEDNTTVQAPEPAGGMANQSQDMGGFDNFQSSNESFTESFNGGDDSISFNFSDNDFDDGFEEYGEYSDGGDDFDFDALDKEVVKEAVDPDTALDNLQAVENGMYTRRYLYDMFSQVLPHTKPSFSSVKKYDEESETFLYWDNVIQRASSITGLKESELPYLKELEENLFTIKATITRSPKMKAELIADEVAKAYAFKIYDNDEDRAKVFAKVDTVLDECIITVFTGESEIISLKDMYSKCEDYIVDIKNKIPVVLGVNEKGSVIYLDLKKVESMIVAGMPRSGKSWLVQAILTQMCALASPKDISFFVLDPKADTSDFIKFKLPHIKKFASKFKDSNGNIVNPDFPDIMETLRYIVNVEAPRRRKLIGGSGLPNISDFRAKYPDVELPYLYVVIDEMVTLSKMDKEDEAEYQSYLDMIVTQFPNLGIRGIFIPHEIKNQIISKTAYDSIKARISVRGSASHIEASTGTKPRDFSYKLVNLGDMAVSIDEVSSRTIFVHGVALTNSNEENNALFDYLRRAWAKIDPDCIKGTVAEGADADSDIGKLLKEIDLDNTDDMDLFDGNGDAVTDTEVESGGTDSATQSFEESDESPFDAFF